jgi:glycosyltransferase involved in cell wall biosynthesis
MISVIVVTYNRKLLLNQCLESILTQIINKEVEIIVIDNCSCDGTEDFIKNRFGDRVKFFKNKARLSLWSCKTLGFNLAGANKIIFIDDDCIASKNWLNEARKSLISYDFVGGAVLPMSTTKFPRWWNKSLNWLIGINPEPSKKFLPLGSNVTFNKYVLDGLQKNNKDNTLTYNQFLPYVEDNYRINKALTLGFLLGINPNMIVYHQVSKQRLKINYLIKRSYNEGRALATYKNGFHNILFSFFALPYNLARLFISLDINRGFRMIAYGSHILNCLKNKFINRC